MSFAKAGLLVGNGPVTNTDLDVIRQAQLGALKLRAIVNPASDLAIYRDVGIHTFLVQALSPEPAQQPTSPRRFVDYFAPAIESFVRAGVRDFEIHGEPSRVDCGYGLSWASPAAFGDWFVAVAEMLKTTFGPQIRAGFPGLTPSSTRQVGATPAVLQNTFLAACSEAIKEAADLICCQIYWNDAAELRALDGGMSFIRQYLETFPTVPLVISEFSNVNPNTNSAIKGSQYAELYFTCAQYDECRYDWPWLQAFWPRLQAAYAFILRSPDPAYASQVWIDADGQPRQVASQVAERFHMPPSTAMRFVWPTEFRHYTQFYGENQQDYYDSSFAHSLHGGHNGVDMQVNRDEPASSPIRACLGGVVTDKQMIETGYGHHAYITSEVEGVGQVTLLYGHMSHVTVEKGQTVQAGDAIGSAGSSGASSGPHLHLSFKIAGIKLPANGDHLNARPYLDPVPPLRGGPRTPYSRTYVLLPPEAGAAWAQAVVDAAWNTQRFTIGGSADDAGIGDLDLRRVVAVNPASWGGDGSAEPAEALRVFFETHYPGVIYVPIQAQTPTELGEALESLPKMPEHSPAQPATARGKPRVPYARTYVLLPPQADAAWASAVVEGAWDTYRFTIGGSADDAGIGDLDLRRVIAINPAGWGDDGLAEPAEALLAFFDTHYPGVLYVPLTVDTPQKLTEQLKAGW